MHKQPQVYTSGDRRKAKRKAKRAYKASAGGIMSAKKTLAKIMLEDARTEAEVAALRACINWL